MSTDPGDSYDLADDAPPPRRPAARPAPGAAAGSPPHRLGYAGATTMPVYDNADRARRAGIMLRVYGWFYVALTLIGLVVAVALLAGALDLNAEAEAGMGGTVITFGIGAFVLGLAMLALFVVTIVFYCMWQYRAVWNARAVGRETRHSPGWGVGWWFVPIANLFVPKRVLSDLWDASGADRATRDPSRPGTLYGLWVGTFVVGVVGNVLGNVGEADPSIGIAVAAVVADLISSGLWIAFLFLLARFVADVQGQQPPPTAA